QQRQPDFPQSFGDVGLIQRAAGAQAIEDSGQLVRQCFEHWRNTLAIRAGARRNKKAPLREPSRSGVAPAFGGDRVARRTRMAELMSAVARRVNAIGLRGA